METEIARLSAHRMLELYRARTLSPVEVVRALLARIEAIDPKLNAFCLVDHEFALGASRQSEQRWLEGEPEGLLDGVPVAIKDVLLTKGWPTLRGSRTVSPAQAWDEDAPAVARLREQGAILLGKTTTPEFHWKTVTDSPLTGVTRNPWDPALTPGGSCGGSAVAVAGGMVPLAVGTDGGGSIRVPCSFCGIVGLKPTFGRVPLHPPSAFGTLAHAGPMTRSVADAALMLNVMALPDSRDWHALPHDGTDYRAGLAAGAKGLTIAFSADLGHAAVDPAVAELVGRSVGIFEDLGARVEEATPALDGARQAFEALWYAGAAEIVASVPMQLRERMDPGLLEIAEEGARIDLPTYRAAMRARVRLGTIMRRFHDRYDLLLTPTLPVLPFPVGRDVPDPKTQRHWVEWVPFSYPFNLTKQPAATVPCGTTAGGLPVGLQIVGPLYGESKVLRACHAFERAAPILLPDLA